MKRIKVPIITLKTLSTNITQKSPLNNCGDFFIVNGLSNATYPLKNATYPYSVDFLQKAIV